MLTVVTWLWNQPGFRTKYNAQTVITMRDMIKKYYNKPHRFVCVTDENILDIETISLGDTFSDLKNPTWENGPSCYRRLIAFKKDIGKLFGERFISIDLDAIIMGDLSPIFDRTEEAVFLSGISKAVPYCGSLFMLNAGCRQEVWVNFNPDRSPSITESAGLKGSDQAWISYCLKNEATWQYGKDILDFSHYTKYGKLEKEKPDCSIIFFNGKLKPWDKKVREQYPWIKEYYNYETSPRYRICIVQFDNHRNISYKNLNTAYKNSIRENMPDAGIDEILLKPMVKDIHKGWVYTANTIKLKAWVDYLEKTNEPVIFSDCDMLAIGDGSKAFIENPDFDIAFTGNLNSKNIPLNGGIVFVRPNERSRSFFRHWLKINEMLYNDEILHRKYRARWAGMNQAALGYMFDNGYPECKILFLPRKRWNATEGYWQKIDKDTVFVHVKEALRKLVLNKELPGGIYKEPMLLWYKYAGPELSPPVPVLTKKVHHRIPNRWL